MTATDLLDRLAPATGDHVGSGGSERGRAWLAANGLPDPRAEAWRYTPLDVVLEILGSARPAPHATELRLPDGSTLDTEVIDRLAGDHGGPRVVHVDGRFAAELSSIEALPAGVRLDTRTAGTPTVGITAPADDDPGDGFDALNLATAGDVTAIRIRDRVEVPAPLHIVHVRTRAARPDDVDDGAAATHPRTRLRLGEGATLHLIETFIGFDPSALTNSSTRLAVGSDARLTHHRIVDEHPDAVHIGRTDIHQAGGSTVRSTSLILDGRIVRSGIHATLAEAGATIGLDGLHLPTGRQRHDHALTIDHAAPGCTSDQHFRGIVSDRGRGSFGGHVIVRHGADGTAATQSNPNLVLSPTAQADTRPWLEILADDVRCTHGATVGRLDDDARFYLRSRGIPFQEATAMLIAAFAGEIVDAVSPASLRAPVEEALRARSIGGNR